MEQEQDLEIKCVQCRNLFIFKASEQRFFKDNGLYPPKRCPVCRLENKKKNEK